MNRISGCLLVGSWIATLVTLHSPTFPHTSLNRGQTKNASLDPLMNCPPLIQYPPLLGIPYVADYYSNPPFYWGNIITPAILKGKLLPHRELLVITPKAILFIFWKDLVKSLLMSVNSINLKKFPYFTSKVHPRVCWVIFIILKLQSTEIDNDKINIIDTINMIDRINCINQYEDNISDWSDLLTLQTSPTKFHHCCFLFWFAWLIKVRSIFVLHSVSSCW